MDLDQIIKFVSTFVRENTFLAAAAGLVLLFLMYKKPKVFFSMLFLGLFLAGVFYMIMSMADSGSSSKRRLIQKDEKSIENTN